MCHLSRQKADEINDSKPCKKPVFVPIDGICKNEADKAIYGYEKDVMGRKDAGLRQKWERFKEHA